ncbi:FAD-dependent oxidoreductase [Castellaniella sp.]|uniref:FAD-dependent oxidoreductase n=1 Tax=Castellaniella sp. TaxID=1955812 RepID=UPI003C752DBC
MLEKQLSKVDGQCFDVVVVGGGAAGASAAQNLIAQGYKVLLVEKGDFASGTSSRSSRLLYCGLAHLSPDHPVWQFALRPGDLMRRLHMARLAMKSRTQLVTTMPERLSKHDFLFPVYRGGQYPGWKVDLGFRLLELLGCSDVRLDYRRFPARDAARRYGMAKYLADNPELESVGAYTEYQYHWAERICLDTILDAEDMGAVVLNYARASHLQLQADRSWKIDLEDSLDASVRASVYGRMLVNTAGPWVDRVLALSGTPPDKKHLIGIKGVNLMVKLPPECRGQGLETISSIGQPYYCMPWGDHHFLGPTDTVFEGDPGDARVTAEEVEYVLREANHLFPSIGLSEKDIVHRWCGIRPRTAAQGEKDIVKLLSIHELEPEGFPNAIAVTGMPIMNHRYAGEKIAERVGRTLQPSQPGKRLSHAARLFPAPSQPAPLADAYPAVDMSHLSHAARREHVRELADLMFRRVGLGWEPSMGLDVVRRVAGAIAPEMGWSEAQTADQVRRYESFVQDNFGPVRAGAGAKEAAMAATGTDFHSQR